MRQQIADWANSPRPDRSFDLNAALADEALEVAGLVPGPVPRQDVENVRVGRSAQQGEKLREIMGADLLEPLVFTVSADRGGTRPQVLAVNMKVAVIVKVCPEVAAVGTASLVA